MTETAQYTPPAQYTPQGFRELLEAYGIEAVWDAETDAPHVRAWKETRAEADGWSTRWTPLDRLAEARLGVSIADAAGADGRPGYWWPRNRWRKHLDQHLDQHRVARLA